MISINKRVSAALISCLCLIPVDLSISAGPTRRRFLWAVWLICRWKGYFFKYIYCLLPVSEAKRNVPLYFHLFLLAPVLRNSAQKQVVLESSPLWHQTGQCSRFATTTPAMCVSPSVTVVGYSLCLPPFHRSGRTRKLHPQQGARRQSTVYVFLWMWRIHFLG